MRPRCEYLRESCLCTRISGVEGVLFDWVRLSLRWESCTGRPDCARQVSNGGNNSLLAGLLNIRKQQHKITINKLVRFSVCIFIYLNIWNTEISRFLFIITDINRSYFMQMCTILRHYTSKAQYTLSQIGVFITVNGYWTVKPEFCLCINMSLN